MMRMWRRLTALLLVSYSSMLWSLEFGLGNIDLSWNNRVSLGAAWRVENRDPALIGKLNLNPDLCPDGCISLSGDPEPNQRLVDAPGAYLGHEQDDGNMSYDQGDMVAAVAKWTTTLQAQWRDTSVKLRGIGFYDAINSDFLERHFNTAFQPQRVARDVRVDGLVGSEAELLDWSIAQSFSIGDRFIDVSLGQQYLRWGESALIPLNSLAEINPPDARRLRQPGFEVNEVFRPVPMAVISGDLFPQWNLTAQAFYQWKWRPVVADPAGSFFGTSDQLYRDNSVAIFGLGNYPEDPQGQNRISNDFAALLTNTSFTAQVRDDRAGYARDDGQFGLKVSWFGDFLLPSTEWSLHAMQYHSRLPYGSAMAAEETCLRDAVTDNLLAYVAACQGFQLLGGQEPLPLDTIELLIEYPEDIQLYGLSFNTNWGSWSIAGEYTHRPNLPLQVHAPDLTWAALNPAFPEEDIVIGVEGLLGALGGALDSALQPVLNAALSGVTGGFPIVVPGARNALPDDIETGFRGNTIQGRQYIPGFERFAVDQLQITGIRLWGASAPLLKWLRADQLLMLVEVGAMHIRDLPDVQDLQLESGTPRGTHNNPGADGSGQPDGQPDTRLQNPTQQTTGFVTAWSWGYRSLFRLEYNDVFGGMQLRPLLIVGHDPQGTAPRPMQNFIEDRIDMLLGADLQINQQWSASLRYQMFHGDGDYALRDRDNVSAAIALTF
nr:DUF1302 domain-containing protein [Oceanococcus sp. HetDA_MAG_MS8]